MPQPQSRRLAIKNLVAGTAALGTAGALSSFTTTEEMEYKLKGNINHSVCRWCYGGIPLEEFKDQYNSPVEEKAFLDSLKENNVRFLIYKDLPGSRLKDLIAKIRVEQKQNGITLEEIIPKPRTKTVDGVVVYRIHEGEMAELDKIRPTSQHHRN